MGSFVQRIVGNQRVTRAPLELAKQKDDFLLRKTPGRRLQSRPVLPSIVSQGDWGAASPNETSRTHSSDFIDFFGRGAFIRPAQCKRSHNPEENKYKATWTQAEMESHVPPVA